MIQPIKPWPRPPALKMPEGLTLIEQAEWKAKQPPEIPRKEIERFYRRFRGLG